MLIYYIVQGAFSHAHFSAWPAAVKTYERSQICQNPTNYDFLGARKVPLHHIAFYTTLVAVISETRPRKGVSNERIQHHTRKVIDRPQQANSIPGRGTLPL